MQIKDVRRGDLISIPGFRGTYKGLCVARVKQGGYKSYLTVSFHGGRVYHLRRSTEVRLIERSQAMKALTFMRTQFIYNEEFERHMDQLREAELGLLGRYRSRPGVTIEDAVAELIELATHLDSKVSMMFADVEIYAHPRDVLDSVMDRWRDALEASREG